jgi:hypothetical protein
MGEFACVKLLKLREGGYLAVSNVGPPYLWLGGDEADGDERSMSSIIRSYFNDAGGGWV